MNLLFLLLATISLVAAYCLGFIHGAKRTYRIYEKEKERELIEKYK
ncbi:hypothetical protein KKI24_11685 [bacterium]|nr:hypothetical protein [bacterium]